MPSIPKKHKPLLLEAIQELLYKTSLELIKYKGGPLSEGRKELTNKQKKLEELQHLISCW